MNSIGKIAFGLVGGIIGMAIAIEISYAWESRPEIFNLVLWLVPIVFAAAFGGYSQDRFELSGPALIAAALSIPVTIVLGIMYMCSLHGDCFR